MKLQLHMPSIWTIHFALLPETTYGSHLQTTPIPYSSVPFVSILHRIYTTASRTKRKCTCWTSHYELVKCRIALWLQIYARHCGVIANGRGRRIEIFFLFKKTPSNFNLLADTLHSALYFMAYGNSLNNWGGIAQPMWRLTVADAVFIHVTTVECACATATKYATILEIRVSAIFLPVLF